VSAAIGTSEIGGRVMLGELDRFCRAALAGVGADAPTVDAAARAMLHGTRHGVDSHGVRLLPHYVTVLNEGRVNRRPTLAFSREGGATASLDADDAHGALAAYIGMERAVRIAGESGIGAVSIRNSSHFGPAGAFALAAAEKGMIGVVFCNSDSFVRLHDGAARFHGTNPIACAVPCPGERPWLLDMATSAVPYNRVQLYRSLGRKLPEAVASDGAGRDTTDAEAVEMLAPVGAAFGFKGAGLAGMVEIFSAILGGMAPGIDVLPMAGPDLATPRGLGAFVMAVRPEAFVGREVFEAGMRRYVEALRASPARPGNQVMAPGDREWAEAARREALGAPVDPETMKEFQDLAKRYGLASPAIEIGGT
jgi:LDH2 family malate/lactate/ureidoglycolate dehydrogenase